MAGERLEASKTGLLVFDMYEGARKTIEARGMDLAPTLRLLSRCRELAVPVFFTRPVHRGDGKDLARTLPDMDREHRPYGTDRPHGRTPAVGIANSPETLPLEEFDASPADYDITKHRWSAFFATALDLSLRTAGVENLLVLGGTTHIGVASTVYSARDLDYQVYVVRDGCHGTPAELASLLDDIFPQVCHVRTADEIIAALE